MSYEGYAVGGYEKEDEKQVKRCKNIIKCFAKLMVLHAGRAECLGIQSSDTRKSCHVNNHLQPDSKTGFQIQKRHAMRSNPSRNPLNRILCCHIPI